MDDLYLYFCLLSDPSADIYRYDYESGRLFSVLPNQFTGAEKLLVLAALRPFLKQDVRRAFVTGRR